ncbi:Peptidyl-tRNA hydrolase [Clostridiaceae bacterium JG1575]|nr:Peptidyl-tRNA hydrolase [Clostridiaceae bacterium JG1575]
MFIVIGLGNPGAEYQGTRHNAGFDFVDRLARKTGIEVSKKKFKGLFGEGFYRGEKLILVKPQTYMNRSGESAAELLQFYKPDPEDFLVVYDDVALRPGAVRLRERGSAGGHNGMKSIIACLGTQDFPRLRIGVGGARGSLVSHVLGKLNPEDVKAYDEAMALALLALDTLLSEDISLAMSRVNASGKPPKQKEPTATEASGASKAAKGAQGEPCGEETP